MNQELDIMGIDEIELENTPIDEIDNEIVNLIFVGIDQSGSMYRFVSEMKNCLNDFKTALINSKEADELLIARANFDDYIQIGGYKKVDQFDTGYKADGNTVLYDVVVEGSNKLIQYMDYLKQQGMRVKAVFAIFSDGEDTASRKSLSEARNKVTEMNNIEIVTAFISFGSGAENEAKRLGFKNILKLGSSASELRRAFNCLSKSVIESSKSVVANTDDFFTI